MKRFDWILIVFVCLFSTVMIVCLFQNTFYYFKFNLETSEVDFGVKKKTALPIYSGISVFAVVQSA
jgi:hypothetical protein